MPLDPLAAIMGAYTAVFVMLLNELRRRNAIDFEHFLSEVERGIREVESDPQHDPGQAAALRVMRDAIRNADTFRPKTAEAMRAALHLVPGTPTRDDEPNR